MAGSNGVKILLAAILVAISIGLIFKFGRGRSKVRGNAPPNSHFYYDLQSGDLIAMPAETIPPIATESGGEGVQAHVYTCDTCTQDALLVGYLQTFNEQAAEAMRQLQQLESAESADGLFATIQMGTLVALPPEPGEQPAWIVSVSPAAMDVTKPAARLCDGKAVRKCNPDDVN